MGPIVFGLGVTLGRLLGLDLGLAASIPVVAGGALGALHAWRDGESDEVTEVTNPGHNEPNDAGWKLALIIGAIILIAGTAPGLIQDALRIRDDARLHIPIVQRILTGSFPPENPFLAGEPLAYFWFFHAAVAGLVRLWPAPIDLALTLFNSFALLITLGVLDAVARRMGASGAARAATLGMFAFGLSPWGWMRFLQVQLANDEINWALMRASGASSLFPMLCPEEPRLAATLTKVAITNALPMSLALALAALAAPARSAGDSWRRGVLIVGTLLFHLATGILLLAGLGLREAFRLARHRPVRPTLQELIVLLVAAAITLPYVLPIVSARSAGTTWEVGFFGARGLSLTLAIALPLVLAAFELARRREDHRIHWYLAAAIPALLLPWFFSLLGGNEYKATFFLLTLLAPPAGMGLLRLVRGRGWAAAVVLLAGVPTTWLALGAFVAEVPPGVLSRDTRTQLEQSAESLPADGVLWNPDPGQGYSTYNIHLGLPSYASDLYALWVMGQLEAPQARARTRELAAARDGRLPAAVAQAARAMTPRPLLLMVSRADQDRFPTLLAMLEQAGARVLLTTPGLSVYRMPDWPESAN